MPASWLPESWHLAFHTASAARRLGLKPKQRRCLQELFESSSCGTPHALIWMLEKKSEGEFHEN
jgi:hypothetical protein